MSPQTVRFKQTLRFKLGFYLSVALWTAMLVFIALVTLYLREQLYNGAADHVTQLSEVITKSTRYAMLQNQPTYVDRIIHDVASQGSIDKVRIFSKDGRIINSTHAEEIGRTLDRKAEECNLCHADDRTPSSDSKRTWTFAGPLGGRLLGSMELIRNEPSCYNAACHHHSKDTPILGILGIVYSLDEIERETRSKALWIAGFALAFVIVASFAVGLFVHRLVYRPLRDLEEGAGRLAAGNLDQPIPVRSDDEFGQLAHSFNDMTTALRGSRAELQEWGHTLEQRVEHRTEQLRRAQAEAARGEKLASVGQLASGVAHELNNPLTGILTFSTLLRQKLPDGSQDAEDVDLVIRETKRCAGIIKRLLDFARDKPPEKRFIDLNQVIEDTVRIVERQAQVRDIEIALDLDRTLPPIWADADQIKQVVMNMLINAQHAIEDKGTITVKSCRALEPKRAEPGAEPVPMVEFAIIDTGCGIAEKNLRRIFDPFFTSKAVGQGTGLGLSVSHGIVQAHGGLIEVESKVGEGSTFRVFLPIDRQDAQAAAAPEMEAIRSS
jgi:two-component system NtrC family sensor kinase